jgi:hypothetical protein
LFDDITTLWTGTGSHAKYEWGFVDVVIDQEGKITVKVKGKLTTANPLHVPILEYLKNPGAPLPQEEEEEEEEEESGDPNHP